MCYYSDDYDSPSVYNVRMPKARKPHKCSECRKVIPVGAKYKYVSGVWNGDFMVFKTCESCLELLQKIVDAELKAGCGHDNAYPPHGYLLEAASEHGLI